MINRVALASVVIVLGLVTGCGRSSQGSGKPVVVATTTQVADFVRTVGGPDVTVDQLLAPNTEAHDYEPSSSDLSAIADATVIVASGAGIDGWIDKLRESAGSSAPVVTAAAGITTIRTGGVSDPHVWMDPNNAIVMVGNIRDGLVRADPAHAKAYRTRAASYIGELKRLDADLARQIATVPTTKRRMVTDHDAFAYFARHFGITIIGTAIPSLASGAEPNSRDLTRLVTLMRREGVRVIFAEAGVNPTIARALADETGVQVAGVLFADSLGPAHSGGSTYVEMMRTNMREIVTGMSRG